MASDDVTLKVLIGIRDAVRATNKRVDKLEERVGDSRTAMDSGFSDLRTSQAKSEIRTATAIHEMGDAIRSVHTLLKDRLDLRDRVERCEHDIEELKRKPG